MVSSNRKIASWSNGSNYAGCREYTIDELIEALEIIFFDTYIQFNRCIFKQILEIPMGGNTPLFIGNLYLSWCEYCYLTTIVKTDHAKLAKLQILGWYLYSKSKVIWWHCKDVYDSTLPLEGSAWSYKQDPFLDLYIRVVDGKLVAGIYHKVMISILK